MEEGSVEFEKVRGAEEFSVMVEAVSEVEEDLFLEKRPIVLVLGVLYSVGVFFSYCAGCAGLSVASVSGKAVATLGAVGVVGEAVTSLYGSVLLGVWSPTGF